MKYNRILYLALAVLLLIILSSVIWYKHTYRENSASIIAEHSDQFLAKQPFFTRAFGLEVMILEFQGDKFFITLHYNSDFEPFLLCNVKDYLVSNPENCFASGYCYIVKSKALSDLWHGSADMLSRYYDNFSSNTAPAIKIVNWSDEKLTIEFVSNIRCKVVESYQVDSDRTFESLIIEYVDSYLADISIESPVVTLMTKFNGNSVAHSYDYNIELENAHPNSSFEDEFILIPASSYEVTLAQEELYSPYEYHDIYFLIPIEVYLHGL